MTNEITALDGKALSKMRYFKIGQQRGHLMKKNEDSLKMKAHRGRVLDEKFGPTHLVLVGVHLHTPFNFNF